MAVKKNPTLFQHSSIHIPGTELQEGATECPSQVDVSVFIQHAVS